MKKLLFAFYILHSAFCIAQTSGFVANIDKASTSYLTWKVPGDYTAYDSLHFVVKACTTSSSCGQLIKKNCGVTYQKPYTTLTCTLYVEDTDDFNAAKYFWSIYAYGVDTVAVRSGVINLQLNGQTPIDGVASTSPIYTIALSPPDYDSTMIVGFKSDSTWREINIDDVRNVMGTGGSGSVPDSVIYPYETADFVTKSTQQTITGQKNFSSDVRFGNNNEIRMDADSSKIVFDDTSYIPIIFKGWKNQGDWTFWQQNFWVNAIKQTWRPDQCFGIGFNWAPGGGRIKANDNAMGLAWESAYEGNMEFWLGFYGDAQYRPFFTTMDSATNVVTWQFQYDQYALRTRFGSLVEQHTDSINRNLSMNIRYNIPNNYAFINQSNGGGTANLSYPYFDSNNRYYLANANNLWNGGRVLSFYQTGLRFDDSYGTGYYYGLSFYNADSNVVNSVYYNGDELRVQADDSERVVIKGSDLMYEDDDGNVRNVIYPALPTDTLGLEQGRQYVDINTGHVIYRIGENLISNGDFSSWTWDVTFGIRPTGWEKNYLSGDSTNAYVENVGSQMHYVNDGNARLGLNYTGTSATVGVKYIYSFTLVNWAADSASVQICGEYINLGYTPLIEGFVTGEVTATSTVFFILDGLTEVADITIDNLRIWKKTGGDIQAPVIYKDEFHPFLNMAVDDTIPIQYYTNATTWDSVTYDVDDSVTIQATHGAGGTEDTLFVSDTVLTGRGTISSFDDNTIQANSEVQLYITAIGDNTVKWWIKIYRRE